MHERGRLLIMFCWKLITIGLVTTYVCQTRYVDGRCIFTAGTRLQLACRLALESPGRYTCCDCYISGVVSLRVVLDGDAPDYVDGQRWTTKTVGVIKSGEILYDFPRNSHIMTRDVERLSLYRAYGLTYIYVSFTHVEAKTDIDRSIQDSFTLKQHLKFFRTRLQVIN